MARKVKKTVGPYVTETCLDLCDPNGDLGRKEVSSLPLYLQAELLESSLKAYQENKETISHVTSRFIRGIMDMARDTGKKGQFPKELFKPVPNRADLSTIRKDFHHVGADYSLMLEDRVPIDQVRHILDSISDAYLGQGKKPHRDRTWVSSVLPSR